MSSTLEKIAAKPGEYSCQVDTLGPCTIASPVRHHEFVPEGDRILIGVSGGKDSIFLVYALAIMRQRLKKNFSLSALTINPMFTSDFDTKRIQAFCERLDIPYDTVDVDIAGAIKAQSDKQPCFTCAFFRRGAMNRYATEHGMNKIAYAHHHDDAVETFLMGLLYCFLTVIRPLVYFREQEVEEAIQYHGFTPVPSPCPHDGHTIRQEVKKKKKKLEPGIPDLYDHLGSAMRKGALGELWPASKTRDEMRDIYFSYMGK